MTEGDLAGIEVCPIQLRQHDDEGTLERPFYYIWCECLPANQRNAEQYHTLTTYRLDGIDVDIDCKRCGTHVQFTLPHAHRVDVVARDD